MVSLKNATKKDNIVITEYYPEGNEKDTGHIEYDLSSKTVLNLQYCEADKNSNLKAYSKKAIQAIEKISKLDNFPKSYDYMWY